MRTRIACVIASLALIGPAGTSATQPIAHASCSYHRINGQTKCIAAGQYCSRNARAMRDYCRYGYACVNRDYNGRYHLVRM